MSLAGGERRVSGTDRQQRRVLALRCPAWPPPAESDPGDGPGAREFEQVVAAVQEFCPRIEVLRPGICAFGTRGPARYFGGEAELAGKVTEAVTRLGYDCAAGIADSMFAALLASRDALSDGAIAADSRVTIVPAGQAAAFLAPRSITVLGEPDLSGLLARLGIRTLGEFAALPAAEAGDRFGTGGLTAHRQARGLDPRPLVPRPPAADLSVQAEFDPPADQAERVIFAAKSLAGELHAKLAASGLVCVRLQVQVSCADGAEITRLWRHDGLLSELAVAERVRWQLDGWQGTRPQGAGLQGAGQDSTGRDSTGRDSTGQQSGGQDGDPGTGGVSLLRLIPDQLARGQGRQLGLWGDAVVTDRVARAAIRVQAMLGHDAVRQPVLAGGRGPSDQVIFGTFGDTPATGLPVDRPWPGQIPAPSPATIYPVPRPAVVTDHSGNEVTVTGRGYVSADPVSLSVAGGPARDITAWTGPWPVHERWWDPVRACRKARFQLVTADGAACLAVVQDGQWLIEASYD